MEIYDQSTASQIAKKLLEIKAIKLSPKDPFTWASGWKSPIYCDNRLSLSFPEVRKFIQEKLTSVVRTHFLNIEAIAGVATAGIPQGVLIADKLDVPFIYVRSKAKGHGMENMIEGKITPGQKVVVVEDLVSTGGSSLKAVNDLRAAGFEVLGMVAIFTYGFEISDLNFEKEGVKLYCLSDYSSLLPQALEQGYVSEADMNTLADWRKGPDTWQP
ncbi:orotate phosphoribosyltransferase [Cyclobacterium marinum]|uniref:Orotate phosphoribosyltransferase n=1 Tax=Cyclobacterium marinum (strain ATCC 25205 / DSM 745 / LMG 13164 / NCIMB 1802) TaxID=880070 RepID=G0IUG6_CYCMS|nr:orotate phosphoribosyltransferase [Cyclobacterium marinum]AEL24729.1 Orotate phosphoribosyltransferase [Cyclobacterium marinum DSM 745]MBI0401794.1 orotate phosphoribosyltransferase [Cyclobacterium marinum]MBR9773561.1 orotate phosphoribosyltransferase [Cytophagales bacterium]|tara:strand:+ start:82790 stop:83434 length:645 start_codon:yes stop_codon:yes gene_type:complete